MIHKKRQGNLIPKCGNNYVKNHNSQSKICNNAGCNNQHSLTDAFYVKTVLLILFFVFRILPYQTYKPTKRQPVNGINCLADFFTPDSWRQANSEFFNTDSCPLGHQKMRKLMQDYKNRKNNDKNQNSHHTSLSCSSLCFPATSIASINWSWTFC